MSDPHPGYHWAPPGQMPAADDRPWYFKVINPFTDTDQRDRWPDPPDGAICTTLEPDCILWMRYEGAWEQVGAQGAPGTPGDYYRHVQTAPSTSWVINHGLAFRPNVSVVDSSGREVWPGAVEYPSAGTVTLTFSAAVGGEAYLS
jgi:hypothetical protein